MRLRRNLTYAIKINVADNDFDRYTCIWSNPTQECGDVSRSALNLPVSTYLNETSCVLRFTPAIVSFYAMALTVFNFKNDTSTTPLSRVPIQFIYTDPYDSTINIFKVNYAANANQVGQNLYSFSGVDSISASASQNSLYINNATHFPMGLVSKYQSTWTLIYPTDVTFSQPSTDAYIRLNKQLMLIIK